MGENARRPADPATPPTRPATAPAGGFQNVEAKTQAAIMLDRVTALRANLQSAAETIGRVQGEVSGKEYKAEGNPTKASAHANQVEGFFPAMDHLLTDIERLTEEITQTGRKLKSAF